MRKRPFSRSVNANFYEFPGRFYTGEVGRASKVRNIRNASVGQPGVGVVFAVMEPRPGVSAFFFFLSLPDVRLADSKGARSACNSENKAFRRKYRRRLLLPSPARQCRRGARTV